MISNLPVNPERYRPGVETIEKDEPETARKLAETMLSITQKTYDDSGHATRAVHAKSHGLLEARVEVLGNLPPKLAQGVFSKPATYDAVVRFSTTPGDFLHDSVSTPRGYSLKIMGVEGDRLPGSEDSRSQDFITVNGKEFNSSSAKKFLLNLKGLAATTDRMEGVKEVVAKVARGAEALLEAVGTESASLKAMGGNPHTSLLGESFYAQLPIRFGDYIAKLAIVPVSENLKALKDKPVDTSEDNDVIRHEVKSFFETQHAVWHLQVQLCTNLDDMPVESIKAWDEEKSPFVTVAVITAGPQTAWSQEKSRLVDDGTSFRPWNGIAAHQPLGSIMRVRKLAYERSAQFRSERNPTPVVEPTDCPFHQTQRAAK
jgi:hypothetical protein